MSSFSNLLDRPPASAPDGTAARSPVLTGFSVAGRAAATSLVAVFVPAVLAWAVVGSAKGDWLQTLRLALDAWLLAHRTGIVVAGGHIGISPIGLMLGVLFTCYLGGRRLARTLDPKAEAVGQGLSRAEPAAPPLRALIAFTGAYAVIAGVLSLLAVGPDARPTSAQAILGAGVIAAVGVTLGAAAYRSHGSLRDGVALLGSRLPERLHADVVRSLRLGSLATAMLLVPSVVLFLIAFVLGFGRVVDLHQALEPGVIGSVVLVVAQLAYLPNAVVWVSAYVVGPGFAVGTGTSVTTAGTVLGAVPAVPLLGALPDSAGPAWLELLVVLPLVAGVTVGVLLLRETRALRELVVGCLGSAVAAGLLLGGLAWLSGGPAGPGRLADVGPEAWLTGAWFAAEVLVGAAIAVGIGHFLRTERAD